MPVAWLATINGMPPRLIVFDLDGTLIDSEQDLANSVNATLAHLHRPALPTSLIRTYIGDGASMLLRRALGDPEGDLHDAEDVTSALTFFLDHYRVHKLDHTRPYPGVVEALTTIRQNLPGAPLAVLTNKPVNPSREICAGLALTPFFFQIYGGDSFHLKKPDPTGLNTLITEATNLLREINPHVDPIRSTETVMIGDSAVDIATALGAKCLSIGCTFGLSAETLVASTPDALAHSPADWPALLAAL